MSYRSLESEDHRRMDCNNSAFCPDSSLYSPSDNVIDVITLFQTDIIVNLLHFELSTMLLFQLILDVLNFALREAFDDDI